MTKKEFGSLHNSEPPSAICGLFQLRRASPIVNRLYSSIMIQAGIQPSQFSVLMIVSKFGPISITDLADKMGLERTSMSRNLKPLEKDGYIGISEEGWRRTRLVKLTKSGKAKLRKAIPLWNDAQSKFAKLLGEEDMVVLLHLLDRTAKVAADDSDLKL